MMVSTEFIQQIDEMEHTISALNALNGMLSYLGGSDNINMENFYFLLQVIIEKQEAIQANIKSML